MSLDRTPVRHLLLKNYKCHSNNHTSNRVAHGIQGCSDQRKNGHRRGNGPAAAEAEAKSHRARRVHLLPILVAAAFWQLVPRGLRVAALELRIATVKQDLFRNDLVMRASAAPLHSVMLDAFQSGRVEQVLATDGATCKG